MSLFDSILSSATDNSAVKNIAEKLGIDPATAAKAVAALGEAHQGPDNTVEAAAAQSGLDTGMLNNIVEQIGGEGSLGKFASMLDRDGDGNPLNDIADMASGLFGKK